MEVWMAYSSVEVFVILNSSNKKKIFYLVRKISSVFRLHYIPLPGSIVPFSAHTGYCNRARTYVMFKKSAI